MAVQAVEVAIGGCKCPPPERSAPRHVFVSLGRLLGWRLGLLSVSLAILFICFGADVNIMTLFSHALNHSQSPLRVITTAFSAPSAQSRYGSVPGSAPPRPTPKLPSAAEVREARVARIRDAYGPAFLLGLVLGGLMLRSLYPALAFDAQVRGAGVLLYFVVGLVLAVSAQVSGVCIVVDLWSLM
jgi:hypothetical protein